MSSQFEETTRIKVVLILEIMGKPPEHLITTLEQILTNIGNEKGVEILRKKIHEPTEIKDEEKKGFYTTFSEIEIKVDQILTLAMLVFKYMPAHIEISQPEQITLDNNDWNEIFNELTRRLHSYDEVARVIQIENSMMKQKIQEIINKQKAKKESKEKKVTKSKKK